MANGWKHGNREIKRPKQTKSLSKTENPFSNQSKSAVTANAPRAKIKPESRGNSEGSPR